MKSYRLPALSLVLLLLSACASAPVSSIAQTGRVAAGSGGTADQAAVTATASVVPTGVVMTPTATTTHMPTATPLPKKPPAPAATRQPAPLPATSGTVQSVWETFYAAIDNDPAGSRDIAYPAPQGIHSQAGGTGTYKDPITLASDARWLPVGTRVYAPRWHKYFIMEDECVECEADWGSSHFHHVDLYMPPSLQSGVVACENAATKDQAENDIIILNPDPNRQVDVTPLYTDAGGCVYASHQY